MMSPGEAVAASGGGFFTVEQRGQAWWLIDPAGEPFFSLGVNCLTPGGEKSKYDPARLTYAAWRYYDDVDAWAGASLSRLKQWKFNTVGGWHDPIVRQGEWPYTEVLHVGAEFGIPWIDLFADSFEEQVDQFAARRVTPHRNDSRLIGWYTDNELGWFGDMLFAYHLEQPRASKTRQRIVRILREHYGGDFERLRQDFVPTEQIASFDQLDQGGSLMRRAGGRAEQVVDRFLGELAGRYYTVVCAALRKHDPNHLILGDRYHGYCPDAVVRAAGKHVNVVSTNYDWPRGVDGYLPRCYLRRLHELTGKPVIVTEYYAAATENQSCNPNTGGLFVVVPNQRTRAEVAQARVQLFAAEPYIVGADWFAFSDEPPQGRPRDGEDYNFGLVDIHDQPYALLTAALHRAHVEAPERHARAKEASPEQLQGSVAVRPLPTGLSLESVDSALE
jgi:hypothetical protein